MLNLLSTQLDYLCLFMHTGKAIYKHEDRHYDAECYATFHAKKCTKCYEPLIDPNVKYISYDNKSYHPQCFLCYKCDNSLAGKKFLLDGNNRICEGCL